VNSRSITTLQFGPHPGLRGPIIHHRVARGKTLLTEEAEAIAWVGTFEPGDVVIDIGANVGMFTVLAAKTRGSRVIAFEPESQNYALLNRNIFGNGLGDRVTAYCLAIADGVGFDNIYLGDFQAGGSGHTFGEKLDRKLEPMQPAHIQGCLAATLDGLVEEGIVPMPQHIRIDIDGLEHKVIAGAQTILRDPRLKSLLIGTNQNLEAHRQLVRDVEALGFVYSQSQVDGSLGRRTPFDGAANFLFFRTESDANDLVATLAHADVSADDAASTTDIALAASPDNGAGNGAFIDPDPISPVDFGPAVPFSTPIITDLLRPRRAS
jgi:FkbM family methyltransferase